MKDSSTQSWNQVAFDWARHADTSDYRNVFLMPITLELLGNVSGRRLLDLGCGEGGYARALARAGAHITAIDGSTELIKIAQRRAENEGIAITHLVRNANSLTGLPNDSFDVVLASMSLMDVEDYRGSVSEVYRVLKTGGELVMSMTHPCFFSRSAIESYFEKQVWEEKVAEHFGKPVLFRHMPLQDFISVLLDFEFKLVLFREPLATPEQIAQSRRLERLARRPLFLLMKWEK